MNNLIEHARYLADLIIIGKKLKSVSTDQLKATIVVEDKNGETETYNIICSSETDAFYLVFYNNSLVFRSDDLGTVMKFIDIERPEKNGGHYALTK